MSIRICSRESQVNVHTNIKVKVMTIQSQELGFQGKNVHISAGQGMETQAAEVDRGRRN